MKFIYTIHRIVILWSALLALLLPFGVVKAEQLSIGFTEFGRGVHYLNDDSALARFVRLATLGQLVESSQVIGGQPEFLLQLSDSVRSDMRHGRWSFRLKNGIQFSSGRTLHLRDALYSLKRCQQQGVLSANLRFTPRLEPHVMSNGRNIERQWLDVSFPVGFVRDDFQALNQRIGKCPILEWASSELFGAELGAGTNLVSAGPFVLQEFKPGNSITLTRNNYFHGRRAALDGLRLRAIQSASQGLSALRLGTVAALFTNDVMLISRAHADETLEVDSCLGFTVVYRRSLNLVCRPVAGVVDLKYLS